MLTWAAADYSIVYHVARCTLVVTTALITNYSYYEAHSRNYSGCGCFVEL